MTRIGVIVHEDKVLDGGLEALRSVLADLGHADPAWYEVPKSKKAPKKIRKLVRDDGVDRVLVWGGDGMVRRCIQTLIDDDLDASIGILPAGTGNLLAHNLNIPIDLQGAAEVAVNGEPRAIDVGKMNDLYFAVMAGTGFDALMIRDADEEALKERFGRMGYVWAGMKNLGVTPAQAEVKVDGLPWYKGDASCVILANVGTIVGGVQAFPDASPTDGRLEVGVVQARSKRDWARLMSSALARRATESALTETTTAERVSIKLDRTFPWEVDGGDQDRTKRYKVRCVPGAVRICQPPNDQTP
jgi:YegS/Rv2252/BmrU family lipid kinase